MTAVRSIVHQGEIARQIPPVVSEHIKTIRYLHENAAVKELRVILQKKEGNGVHGHVRDNYQLIVPDPVVEALESHLIAQHLHRIVDAKAMGEFLSPPEREKEGIEVSVFH